MEVEVNADSRLSECLLYVAEWTAYQTVTDSIWLQLSVHQDRWHCRLYNKLRIAVIKIQNGKHNESV